MKIKFALLTKLVAPISVALISLVALVTSPAIASDYPQSRLEREIEETGSLLKGDGLTFRPGKERSTATKATIGNVNKYLYQASIDVLKFAPLASSDSNAGVIVTDWYSPKGQKNTQFKVTVYIRDKLISPEALEVVVFQRDKTGGKWPSDYKESPIAATFEDKIIRKARDLYLNSAK
ncbi:MAG: hypothetical protein COA94_07125 [Rickettsiales bacterium]|nr:MAG: hypothetical protein COA94_07125 [Rickettsiales bacterium]